MIVRPSYADLRKLTPDSPGGELLRRVWLPIAAASELTDASPIVPVRVLGEGLVLFRTSAGEIGLMQERCPHNGYSLIGSSVDGRSLICWKHGWNFGLDGACWVTGYQGKTWPVQWANAAIHPVRRWGGVIWTYVGAEPPPDFTPPAIPADLRGIETVAVSGLQALSWTDSLAFALSEGHELILPCHSSLPGMLMLRLPVDDAHTWILAVGRSELQAAARTHIERPAQEGGAEIDAAFHPRVATFLTS